jgi:hypothetical protein
VEPAFGVHRRGQGEHHVGRHLAAGEELRCLGEVGVDQRQPAGLRARARGAAQEHRDRLHVRGRLRVEVVEAAQRQHLHHPHALEALAPGRQALQQGRGLAAADGHHDPVAIAHQGDGILHGGPPPGLVFSP